MNVSAKEAGLAAMTFSRQALTGFLDTIPEDKWCHQAVDGCNHPMWIVGHLAWTDDYFLQKLGGKLSALPADWGEKFGMGSAPSSDAGSYPPVSQIREQFNNLRETVLTWYGGLSEEQLSASLPEELAGFAPNHASWAGTVAWHEGMHAGQLTFARKSLGMTPVFA